MWGVVAGPFNDGEKIQTIRLPAAFAGTNYRVVFGENQTGNHPASFDAVHVMAQNKTTTQFTAYVWNSSGNTLSFQFDYIAIG